MTTSTPDMFNAPAGRQAMTDEIIGLSNTFAALFEELPTRERRDLLLRANAMMSDPAAVSAFQAGTYAQQSNGQPAAQLGPAGGGLKTIVVTDDEERLLERFRNAPEPVQRGIGLGLSGRTPFEADGTPSEVAAARRERDAAQTERDAAKAELAAERDDTKSTSLAGKLKAAKAAPPTPPDHIRKDVIKPLADEAKAAAEAAKYAMAGGAASKSVVVAKCQEVIDALS